MAVPRDESPTMQPSIKAEVQMDTGDGHEGALEKAEQRLVNKKDTQMLERMEQESENGNEGTGHDEWGRKHD